MRYHTQVTARSQEARRPLFGKLQPRVDWGFLPNRLVLGKTDSAHSEASPQRGATAGYERTVRGTSQGGFAGEGQSLRAPSGDELLQSKKVAFLLLQTVSVVQKHAE